MVIFALPDCPQCSATERMAIKFGVPYEKKMLTEHPEVLQEAKARGVVTAPYVVYGDRYWGGFRPDLMKQVAVNR